MPIDASADTSTKERQANQPVRTRTVLAIASAGGHWIQLRRLHPSFKNFRILYATTRESYREEVEADGADFLVVPDCNRWEKFKLLKAALSIFLLILRKKPDVIITTGAAPGYFAIRIGALLGKRTIWVDSIANAEELSLSGRKAGKHVDLWVTQWAHLAKEKGPHFFGNVLGDDTPPDEGDASSELSPSSPNGKKTKVLVTVGTDLPFDRLIKRMDEWALDNPEFEVFAQTGNTKYIPQNIEHERFIEPPQFTERFHQSDLIVSHAGMGTILSSLRYQKPLLVMPRIAKLGEHRNEHQLATANHLNQLNKVNVAKDEDELVTLLSDTSRLRLKAPIGPYASLALTNRLEEAIDA